MAKDLNPGFSLFESEDIEAQDPAMQTNLVRRATERGAVTDHVDGDVASNRQRKETLQIGDIQEKWW